MNPAEATQKREIVAAMFMEAANALTARTELETKLVDVTQRNEKLRRERDALKRAIKAHKARARSGYWRNMLVDKGQLLMKALGTIAVFDGLAASVTIRDGQPRTAAEKIAWVIGKFDIRNQERRQLMAATRRHRAAIADLRSELREESKRYDSLTGELNKELQRYDALETEAIQVIEELESRLVLVENRQIIPITPRRRAAA